MRGKSSNLGFASRQRMAGQKEIERFFLVLEPLAVGPFGHVGQRFDVGAIAPRFENIEHVDLPTAAVLLTLAGGLNRLRQCDHESGSLAENIARARFDQPLECQFWNSLQVNSLAQIEQIAEWSFLFAGSDESFGGAAAQALDGGE